MLTIEHRWIDSLKHQWPQVDFRHDTFIDNVHGLSVTTDMLVEGTHFDRQYSSWVDVGWKAVAVNVSDIAASGAYPLWAFVAVGLPTNDPLADLDELYKGINAACKHYGLIVAGGDTVSSPTTTISVTMIGQLKPNDTHGRRHLARPGDVIAISGPHGLSHAGMQALKQHMEDEFPLFVEHHRRPKARLALGQKLANVLTRYAVMDSSDGLADAVTQLGRHSGCVGIIDAQRLEVSHDMDVLAMRTGQHPIDWVLYGGEDFELVVSLSPEMLSLFPELTVIGRMVSPQSVSQALSVWPNTEGLLEIEGELMPLINDRGFQHFRR